MVAYIIRRVIGLIPIAFIVGVVAFFLIQLSPGDPAMFFVGPDATVAEIEEIRRRLGLDQPVMLRFWNWVTQVVQGDLGMSFVQRRPVTEVFLSRLPVTMWLAFLSLIIALIMGIPIGVYSALKPGGFSDKFNTIFVFIGVSMPNFWLGMLLVLLFAVGLGWLPAQGFDASTPWTIFKSLVMPAFALGYSQAALVARMTRSSVLETMRQDYVQTARAKGLRSGPVLNRYILLNALNPVVTIIGLSVASLVAGSAVIEVVFNLPGIGRLIVDSVIRRDFPMVQGILLLTAGMIILVNLITDLFYAVIDPRVRYD